MWKKLQKLAQHPAVQFVKKICGDPVQLYAIFLMTTIMEYYHEDFTWLYTVISVFLTLGLMKFYDFVAKHKFLGPLCYLAFLLAGLYAVGMITVVGQEHYPITFMVWFLTPQSVVDFSIWYTIAIYLLMTGFLSSAVYYFAKVHYRMVMQFLIMLIPLSLYGKEGLQMPAILVILLLAAYFLLMVYCRQLRETPDIRRIRSFHGTMSVTAYVLAFSILAAVMPKPTIKADREFIENAMSYSTWSDILMEAISMFTDTTDNTAMLSNNTRTLYYVHSPESLRLRTQTYTFYLEDDSWNKNNYADYPSLAYDEVEFYQPRALLQAILDAASADAEFAETYHLTEFTSLSLPVQEPQRLVLITNIRGTNMIPTPTRIAMLQGARQQETLVSRQGALTPETRTYDFRTSFSLDYYSDTYAQQEQVNAVLRTFSSDTFGDLLLEAAAILKESDPESAEFLERRYEERQDALEYLDYCTGKDYQSDAVDALAAELTAGLDSDYEKAKAIEQYFTDTGFVYDLSYTKADGENVDTFLTETRRGVCYEFATAMVLLCRSAGLPARYAQGYSLNEMYDYQIEEQKTNYLIKGRDAHGFPEVYISGYGWLSFEPTVAMIVDADEETAENHYVMLWGFGILGFVLLAGGFYLCLPYLREQYFRRRVSGMAPPQAAAAIFRRMRKTLRLPDSTTIMALAEQSAAFSTNEAFFAQLDALLYDPKRDVDVPVNALVNSYIQWQTARTAHEKEEKAKEKKHR